MSVFSDIVDLAGPPSGDGHGTFNGQQTDIAAQQASLAADAGAEFDPLAITNPDNFASWDHPKLKSAAESLDAEVMHGTGDGWGDMGKYVAGDMRGLELALRSAIAGEWAGRGANQATTAGNAYAKQGVQLGAAIMVTSTKIHEAAVAAAQTKAAVPPPVPIDDTHAVLAQMANPLNPHAMAQDLEVQHRAAEDARAEAVRVMESHYLPVYQASDAGVPVLPLPRSPVSVGKAETRVGSGDVVGSSSRGDNSQWSAPTHSAAWTDPSGTSPGASSLVTNPGASSLVTNPGASSLVTNPGASSLVTNPGGGSAGVGSSAGGPYGNAAQGGVGGYGYGSGSAGASGGRSGAAAGVTRGAGGYGPGAPGTGGGFGGSAETAGYPGLGTSRVTAAGAGGGVPGADSGVGAGYGLGPGEGDHAIGSRGGAYGRGGGFGPSGSGGSFGPGSGGSAGGAYGPGGYGAAGYGAGGYGAGGSGAGGYGPGGSGSNLGRGPTSGVGMGTGSAAEGGAARGAGMAGGGRGATGAGGMGGMGGGRGKGEDDYEHNTPSYLITQEHGSELVGPLPPVSPPVIGE